MSTKILRILSPIVVFLSLILLLVLCAGLITSSADEPRTGNQAGSAVSASPGTIPTPQAPIPYPFSPGRLLVKFRDGVQLTRRTSGLVDSGRASLDSLLAAHRVQSTEPLFGQRSPASSLSQVFVLRLPAGGDVLAAVGAFAQDPDVEWAEPDYLAHAAFIPNDPHYPDQWGLAQVQADQAWDVTQGSPAVTLAIVDTGLDLNHPDLVSKLWVNPGEVPGNGLDDDGNGQVDDINGWDWVNNDPDPQDDIGHGSHVAGIAAAATNNGIGVAGVCPNCRLMALKVLDAGGSGTYSHIAAGIVYAADKGAKVINLSLGGYADSPLLRDAVAYASQYAVVVAAAGNDNRQDRFYPAAYDQYALAVAAIDNSDQKAAFANYGSWVDVAAPGVSIWSTLLDDTYADWSGSSMAAPFVSGVAGLVRSRNPSWSAGAVRGQILHTTESIDGLNPGYEGKLGAGRLNAYRAVSIPILAELYVKGFSVNGSAGGSPEPGDSVVLKVSVANSWGDAAGVSAVLNSTDPAITLTDASATYGDIAGGTTVTNDLDAFAFQVAPGTPYGHPIPLEIQLVANGGSYAATLPFTITVSSEVVPVSGIISQDTVWSGDRTYLVTGNLLVASGVTLTIEAGAEVLFVDQGVQCSHETCLYMRVDGTLIAIGMANSPIIFTSDTPEKQAGQWQFLLFKDGSHGMLSHCVIEAAYAALEGEGSSTDLVVEHSLIHLNSIGFDEFRAGTIELRHNRIVNNEFAGTGSGTFHHNIIAGNNRGLVLRDSAVVESNDILGQSDTGLHFVFESQSETHSITHNNVFGNLPYDARTDPCCATAVTATLNYWGTTDAGTIAQHILDRDDDFTYGPIVYQPYLEQPAADAPAVLWQAALDVPGPVAQGPFTITLDFSKVMSTTVQPTVTFGISPTYDTHVITGDWVGPGRWAGTYHVTYYTGDGLQRLRVGRAVGADDGMEMPEDHRFTFEIATIGAVSINAEPGYGSVHLSWPASDLVTTAGYNLYRSTQSGGPYDRLHDTLLTTPAYDDTAVTNGTAYYYLVRLLTTDLYELDYGDETAATPNDYSPPTRPVVTDDGTCTPYSHQFHATWSSGDPESGIGEYQYSIGTWAGGTDVINWTSAGTDTGVTRTGLSLIEGVTYSFNVRARNGAGTWSQVGSSDGILVSSGCPAVDFAASPRSGSRPLQVQFADQTAGSATSRLWDFGDGAFSTAANPQHTYVTTGSFTVTLTVTGTMGTNSRYKPAYITVREKQIIYLPLVVRSH